MRQIRSQALPWDLLADIETHIDGYLEEKLQQAKNTHNSELKQDPARKKAHHFAGSEKKNEDKWKFSPGYHTLQRLHLSKGLLRISKLRET